MSTKENDALYERAKELEIDITHFPDIEDLYQEIKRKEKNHYASLQNFYTKFANLSEDEKKHVVKEGTVKVSLAEIHSSLKYHDAVIKDSLQQIDALLFYGNKGLKTLFNRSQ